MTDRSAVTRPADRRRSPRLGAQLWVERDSSTEQIERLVTAAAASGLDALRVFLVWPWIEPRPGGWDFGVFDSVFDHADAHGLRIKATLTPDTPPWHQGGPGLGQSRHLRLPGDSSTRPAAAAYIRQCVGRYAQHPALCQWLLWNEPVNRGIRPGQEDPRRSASLHQRWVELLNERFSGDIDALDRRWHTGYRTFEEVPFPEQIIDPVHRDGPFFSFDPWLAEYRLRADALVDELAWVNSVVKELDPLTPTCLNPADLYRNRAEMGYDMEKLARVADMTGASVHAPWHLGFAPRSTHLALAVSALRMLREVTPADAAVELTEIQAGNVLHETPTPLDMSPQTLAAWNLAPLFAGAASVTGWALNARGWDFEAGDWGLLNDDDSLSARSAAIVGVRDVLGELDSRIGPDWTPAPVQAVVGYDEHSDAIVRTHAWTGEVIAGRAPDDPIQGVATLSAELEALGIGSAPAPVRGIGRRAARPELIVLSHLGACESADLESVLQSVRRGSVLLIDGSTAQKTTDAQAMKPWPGVLGEALGYRGKGMITCGDDCQVSVFGQPGGRLSLAYADLEFSDAGWRPDDHVLLPQAGDLPLVWTRSYGAGQVIVFAGLLGPSMAHDGALAGVLRYLIDEVADLDRRPIRSLSPSTLVLEVHGSRGTGIGVFGPDIASRAGKPLRVRVPEGRYQDLWTHQPYTATRAGLVLPAQDGIAVLVPTPSIA